MSSMSTQAAGPRRGEVPYTEVELTPTRKAIADRVSQSKREIPEFLLHSHVDAEPVMELREALKKRFGAPAPSLNDIIVKLCGSVLPRHPTLNAAFVDGKIRLYQEYNVGFAVATEAGVLVPVVRNANLKDLVTIAAETREMIDLARRGRLRASLQQGGTFSISNIGPGSVDAFNAIISPPQTAILAIGTLAPRPYVVGGELTVRRTLNFTLTVDHRAIDGADGAAFLGSLAGAMAAPGPACGVD